ncbi:U3 small nucleolar RNA-associated protein 12 [Kwoniella heveanensis BCC8398]|uniref:U3 small nucleolar RNA-associated protein 12 n=1 Tax=Kwoniella heveanensis BCC8398 TaxID=1296120 RepID=A0A1B9GKY9_9TREE|nr:U3 small nucleolar RNA-associated protein 12 [Kwoniella heveanensis BCC8398]
MVRSYMRHGPTQAFGVICSPTANSSYDGRLAYVAGWEDVLVWDVKRGEMVSMWHSPSLTSPVTYLTPAPEPSTSTSTSPQTFAVSYTDGSIRLWSFDPSSAPDVEASEIVTFNGHKKAITHMVWDHDGSRLASGGTEGEIVVWDRVGEVGLFRLKGHRGPITGLSFIPHPNGGHPGYLVSSSKDTYLKLWDLGTQHCVQTVVVGRGEVTGLAFREEEATALSTQPAGEDPGSTTGETPETAAPSGKWIIVTGSGDGEGKVWSVEKNALARGMAENENGELPTLIQPLCTLPLPSSSEPITQLSFHPTQPLLFLQTSARSTIILRLRSEEEVAAKRARRKKRDREKKKKGKTDVVEEDEVNGELAEGEVKWEERLAVWCTVRANAKVRSFAFAPEEIASAKGGISLLLALSNNSVESYTIPTPTSATRKASKLADGTTPEPVKTHSIELPGHRNDVRTISISSDDQVIASAADGTLKIWNARTTACIRTIECRYAVCSTFLPGDRHVVVGTKQGELLLYDIAASSLLATYKAHKGAVFGVNVRPDGRGLVSGSEDKDVKFWDFEMAEVGEGEKVVSRLGVETVYKTKQLTLVHVRTLKMTDDVLAVKYSPDGRFLAVSLLDSTVKIFFSDTLKFFLSLYGHKLPVLSLDISTDSKLIVTCSADKNVKIWGMDFGDCHKSLFAHDDSVMQVVFEKERGSHYFWTVGKDRMVKYWDGDKFELIQKLEGHHGEVWALATSNNGQFVVTGSHDKSIRIWEKTDEPLFLEEEREKEIEAMYDSNIADNLNRDPDAEGGEGAAEAEAVQKQTAETLMAGEKIMEALEIADADREALREWEEEKQKNGLDVPRPTRNAELIARGDSDADEFVLKTIQKIPAASMEDALLVLPFRQVISLLGYLDEWAMKGQQTVLISRILFFLLRTHSSQMVSNRVMRTPLLVLRNHLRQALDKERERMGYNLAALKFIKGRWESERTAGLYEAEGMDEEAVRKRLEEGRGKRKRIEVRA